MSPFVITLLTDYGYDGPYVGVCHGVIRRILPSATIVDMAHSIAPFCVLQGALVLADAVPYFPVGVHVAVVDPGVGTTRRALALGCADGRRYIGPDNGVLMPAAERSGLEQAVELEAVAPLDETRAPTTFDGRDVFAPAAAALAGGTELAELGVGVDLDSLRAMSIPTPEKIGEGLRVLVAACDRFGTLQLASSREELGILAELPRLAVSGGTGPRVARRATTFAEVEPGDLLIYVDAFGHPALAVREGSAAELLAVGAGDWVVVQPA